MVIKPQYAEVADALPSTGSMLVTRLSGEFPSQFQRQSVRQRYALTDREVEVSCRTELSAEILGDVSS